MFMDRSSAGGKKEKCGGFQSVERTECEWQQHLVRGPSLEEEPGSGSATMMENRDPRSRRKGLRSHTSRGLDAVPGRKAMEDFTCAARRLSETSARRSST
jgi:hypothetical protein